MTGRPDVNTPRVISTNTGEPKTDAMRSGVSYRKYVEGTDPRIGMRPVQSRRDLSMLTRSPFRFLPLCGKCFGIPLRSRAEDFLLHLLQNDC